MRILKSTAITAGLLLSGMGAVPAGERPNIVFFLTDDHTTQAISAYGDRIASTPNIDRIAREGMRFDRAFCTESICRPSRTAFLTGKYGHVTGATGWQAYDRSHKTFPEYLREAGYQTALVGKYHIGEDPPGFDYSDILPGQGRYHDPELISSVDGKRVIEGHVSDVITDLALDWLKDRDTDRPFLLCLNDKSTHMPWKPAKRFENALADVTIPEPDSLFDDFAGRSPAVRRSDVTIDGLTWWQKDTWGSPPEDLDAKAQRRWIYQRYMKHYLRTAMGIDESVGRVLDFLDEAGLARNTVVIYASDQGFFLGEHGWFDKRWMFEESLRLPLLVRYPERIQPGQVSDQMVMNIDVAPTLLSLAGVPVPGDMQGRDLGPLFSGEAPNDWRTAIYYRHYTGEYGIAPHYGIRTERYKLIHYHGTAKPFRKPKGAWVEVDDWELFDLATDPRELTNLYKSAEHQETIRSLKGQLLELRAMLKDQP